MLSKVIRYFSNGVCSAARANERMKQREEPAIRRNRYRCFMARVDSDGVPLYRRRGRLFLAVGSMQLLPHRIGEVVEAFAGDSRNPDDRNAFLESDLCKA